MVLSAEVLPSLGAEVLREVWSSGNRRDKEITEDIVVDECRLPDAESRRVAEQALIGAGLVEHWAQELRRRRVSRRMRAALRLGFVHHPRGMKALAAAAEDLSPAVQLAVILSLGRLKDVQGLAVLIRLARKPGRTVPDLTLVAALAGCATGCPERLVDLLEAPEARTRVIGGWALSEVADRTVLPQVLKAARDPEPEVRAKIARALARIPCRESLDTLCRLAEDPVWFVRVRALDALGRHPSPSGEAAASYALDDEAREVRYRAAYALRQIRGMKGEIVREVLATRSRLSFDSLISEWDRAGFLWNEVAGLSTRDWPRFIESREVLKALIAAEVTRALVHFVMVFPDIKVRLRLVRLLLEAPGPNVRAELVALADQPRCERRVAAKIREGARNPVSSVIPGAHPPNA